MIYQIFTIAVKFALLFSLKILEVIEKTVCTAVPSAGASIGIHPDHCDPRSPACDDDNETKRIKLLLDISMTPGPSGVVVSSTKVTNVPVTTSFFSKIFWLPAYFLLKGSSMARKLLMFVGGMVQTDSVDGTLSRTDDSNRKIISPKKRFKRSSSLWRNFWPNFFPFSLLKKGSSSSFDLPMMEQPGNDDSLNNSRLKSVEKRKRSSSGTDYDTSNPSSAAGSSKKAPQNGNRSPSENNADHVKENEKVAKQGTSGEGTSVRRLSQDLFDVDNDYKSADDPDYSPSEEESSTTDASEEILSEEEHGDQDLNVENNGLALSPATSTTDMHPNGDPEEHNRRGSITLENDSMGSPARQSEMESGRATTFDSPHSTTSYDDERDDGIDL